jgi:hypothetical protein
MRPLIRFTIALFILSLFSLDSFGGSESVKPVNPFNLYDNHIERLDSFLTVRNSIQSAKTAFPLVAGAVLPSAGRICSCQILNLGSSNYDHRYVVLLAEKTNDGSGEAYIVAKNRIQKEKKFLKQMFYDKVKVVAEMQGTGTCKSMFYQLRTADKNLKLYEILNADLY